MRPYNKVRIFLRQKNNHEPTVRLSPPNNTPNGQGGNGRNTQFIRLSQTQPVNCLGINSIIKRFLFLLYVSTICCVYTTRRFLKKTNTCVLIITAATVTIAKLSMPIRMNEEKKKRYKPIFKHSAIKDGIFSLTAKQTELTCVNVNETS